MPKFDFCNKFLGLRPTYKVPLLVNLDKFNALTASNTNIPKLSEAPLTALFTISVLAPVFGFIVKKSVWIDPSFTKVSAFTFS